MVSVVCAAAQKTLLFGLRAPAHVFLTELGPDVVERTRQIGMLPATIMSLEGLGTVPVGAGASSSCASAEASEETADDQKSHLGFMSKKGFKEGGWASPTAYGGVYQIVTMVESGIEVAWWNDGKRVGGNKFIGPMEAILHWRPLRGKAQSMV